MDHDWVYEEEFSFTQAFEWSPDSKCMAYYRFDETNVPEFTITNYVGELYLKMKNSNIRKWELPIR